MMRIQAEIAGRNTARHTDTHTDAHTVISKEIHYFFQHINNTVLSVR